MVVHRQVKSIERGEKLFYSAEDNELDMLGDHTSGRERRAQEAEMEATTIKSLEYMKAFEGEEFDGFVSGVQNFGVFIELVEYPVEGFIRRDALGRDRYELDELGIKLIGQNSGHTIKLGDKIRVYIDKVEPLEQRLDLSIVHQEDAGDDVVSPAKGKRKKGRR